MSIDAASSVDSADRELLQGSIQFVTRSGCIGGAVTLKIAIASRASAFRLQIIIGPSEASLHNSLITSATSKLRARQYLDTELQTPLELRSCLGNATFVQCDAPSVQEQPRVDVDCSIPGCLASCSPFSQCCSCATQVTCLGAGPRREIDQCHQSSRSHRHHLAEHSNGFLEVGDRLLEFASPSVSLGPLPAATVRARQVGRQLSLDASRCLIEERRPADVIRKVLKRVCHCEDVQYDVRDLLRSLPLLIRDDRAPWKCVALGSS